MAVKTAIFFFKSYNNLTKFRISICLAQILQMYLCYEKGYYFPY